MSRTSVALCAACLVLWAAPDSLAQQPRVCGPAGARTVRANADARVFAVRRRPGERYGCVGGSKRVFSLRPPGDYDVGLERLQGRFAIVVTSFDEGLETYSNRRLIDLVTGRALDFPVYAARVVIASDGAFAFVQDPGAFEVRAFEVRKTDRQGVDILLDGDFDISPTSLRLRGGRIVWRNGEQERSAPLVGPPSFDAPRARRVRSAELRG